MFSSSIILRENNGKSTSFFFSFRGDLYFSVRVDFLKGVDVPDILKQKKNCYIRVSNMKEII